MLQIRTSSAVAGRAPTRRRAPIRAVAVVLGAAVAVALMLPVASAAARPTRAERLEARTVCAEQRGIFPYEHRMFRRAYGGRRAFRKCMRRQARILARERGAELPAIRGECQMLRLENPLEFRMEFPGGVRMCVRMETAP
jgi:hypothetical protein